MVIFNLIEKEKTLPIMYWIPKMQKKLWAFVLSLHLNFALLKEYQNRCHIFLKVFILKLEIFIKMPIFC